MTATSVRGLNGQTIETEADPAWNYETSSKVINRKGQQIGPSFDDISVFPDGVFFDKSGKKQIGYYIGRDKGVSSPSYFSSTGDDIPPDQLSTRPSFRGNNIKPPQSGWLFPQFA